MLVHHEICDSSYTPVKFCSLFFEKMPAGSGEPDCRRLEWAVGAGKSGNRDLADIWANPYFDVNFGGLQVYVFSKIAIFVKLWQKDLLIRTLFAEV